MAYKIKFGTDGWRAIIAKEYTVENVRRVADATARWMIKANRSKTAIIGFDCRFGGSMFMKATAEAFAQHGIKSIVSESFVSTPMVSLACNRLNAGMGIVITASHNPPDYNGFKIKDTYGGPATPQIVQEIEDMIPDQAPEIQQSYADLVKTGMVEFCEMEDMYYNHVQESFNMASLTDGSLNFAYDAMYGAGQDIMRRLMPEATFLHCEHNPGFDGQAPEPIHKNLTEFSQMIQLAEDIDSGLATDGDADRVGLYNREGKFVDSHHIILLLVSYLHKVKGLNGKVVKSFSCTSKIDKLCAHYGLECQTTKIGFKYICDIMVNEDVLIGGEESGGIAIKGHVPERDGIWIGLVIWEYMAKSGKSLDELIDEVYAIVGRFAVERYDLHLDEAKKQHIVAQCKARGYNAFGEHQVEQVEDIDGYKFHLSDDRWVMIRPSGTEPVLRVYAEAASSEDAFAILDATKATILA
ncbi:MAG: phosphoglucomutase/phosphomannomutase family protein [Flavobacteriales bacterium]|nr:phosphoglucomutase/phosphomannomutase family protein [Bacteroidota bacterium]MCB9241797.1 phosphoglucomutase/phosphomannomutase family protein [Flavobacteriales bacterium]